MPSRTIPAGEFNRRITILNPVLTRGTSGSVVESWVTTAKDVPCKVKINKGRESFDPAAQRILVVELYTFILRYRTDVTTKSRFTYAGRTWDAQTITEVGRREAIEILAQVVE
jgi:SPP1 family predicted phage head-tail adaptor